MGSNYIKNSSKRNNLNLWVAIVEVVGGKKINVSGIREFQTVNANDIQEPPQSDPNFSISFESHESKTTSDFAQHFISST